MEKTILIIQELMPEQIEELKVLAPDYKIVESLEEAPAQSLEIILGWTDKLLPLIESDESNVKWIQFPYAGVNKLPLQLFAEKGILLTNGSGIHAHSVTETTMGLILGMTRNIVEASKNQQAKKWQIPDNKYELNGKTLLVVGAGKIGEQLGRVAQAFGMKTIGINRSGSKIKYMDKQFIQSELADIIGQAHIVVNILPDTEATKKLYDAALFSKMKDDAYFINVGRGETVVTKDLLEALDRGKLQGAGLDVFEVEPLPKDHPLWSHEKVLMTPHIAGQVENYAKHLFPIIVENFEAFQQKKELPRNLVELTVGY